MRTALQIIAFISPAFVSSVPLLTFAQTASDAQIVSEIQERAQKRKNAAPVGVVGGQWIELAGKKITPLKFFADGSVSSGSYWGSWTVVGPKIYSVRWPNGTMNRLTISDDGATMSCITTHGGKQNAPYHLRRSQ